MDNLNKIIKSIFAINSTAEFTFEKEDIDNIKWINGTTPISKSDIEAKMVEIQTAYDNNEYQRDRATAYPTIQEQLDMQYWDNVNGTTTWEDAIAKVKADNPKD